MKKNFTRLLTLVLALAMTLTLAACGGNDKPAESPDVAPTVSAPSDNTVNNAVPEAAAPDEKVPSASAPVRTESVVLLAEREEDPFTITYAYDEMGRLISETEVFTSDGEFMSETTYTYGADGLLDSASRHINDWAETRDELTYDDAGRLSSELTYKTKKTTGEELLSHGVDYTYDDAGNLICTVAQNFSNEGESVSRRQVDYTYDDAGRLITETTTDSNYINPIEQYFYTYEFDSEGRVTAKIQDTENPYAQLRFDYTYDEAGNLVREDRSRPFVATSSAATIYEYDEMGNLISETKYDTFNSGGEIADTWFLGSITYTYKEFQVIAE